MKKKWFASWQVYNSNYSGLYICDFGSQIFSFDDWYDPQMIHDEIMDYLYRGYDGKPIHLLALNEISMTD